MSNTSSTPKPPKRTRTILVWLERVVTVALLIFVVVRLAPQVEALTGVQLDHGPAPPLHVVTLAGDTLGPEQLAGKVVVVNFWATWCRWCRLEMPSLEHLYEHHRGDDLVVLGLSVDVGALPPIRAFLRKRHITYPVARATRGEQQAFGGVGGTPTTVVVDRSGTIRYRVVGYFAPPALGAAVTHLLDEPSPAQEARTRESASDR